jgi:hypothetical protein
VDEIVAHLTEKYKDRGWDFSPLKSPQYPADFEAIREAAQAFDDMMQKHPYIKFRDKKPLVIYKYEKENVNGFARNDSGYISKGIKTYTKDGQFIAAAQGTGTTLGRNTDHYIYETGQNGDEIRDYNLDAMNRSTYYTMVHEMGHMLDYTGRGRSQQRIRELFEETFTESPEGEKAYQKYVDKYGPDKGQVMWDKAFDEILNIWLRDKLVSDYSYTSRNREKGAYITESIAEAVLDVEIRGEKANTFSKKIYDLVIEEAKKGAQP